MKDGSFIKKIFNFILRTRTMILVNILLGIGLFIFVLSLFIVQKNEDSTFLGLSLALSSFFVGLSGLIIIIKKEVNYTIIRFNGFPAVVIGALFTLAGFMSSILFTIGTLRSITK